MSAKIRSQNRKNFVVKLKIGTIKSKLAERKQKAVMPKTA